MAEKPDAPAPPVPVIVIKRVAGHGGHHGGAWKVAYADFVTAMMALFIVLWLMNSSEVVKKAVAGYFLDPTGYGKQLGSAVAGTGESMALSRDDMPSLRQKLEKAMKEIPEFQQVKDQVQITVTGEGLRVELLETEKGMFFQTGSPKPSKAGEDLLVMLAQELGRLSNRIVIEGHTDSRPFAGAGTYSNWELSSDRANSARRLMQQSGLQAGQVVQVRGFADQNLRNREDPNDPNNRRVSVIVRYRTAPSDEVAAGAVNGERSSEQASKKGKAEK